MTRTEVERGYVMTRITLPMTGDQWDQMGDVRDEASLLTPIALSEAATLEYIEEKGVVTLEEVVNEVSWPDNIVLMGVGALVRERLIQARKSGDHVLLRCLGKNKKDWF